MKKQNGITLISLIITIIIMLILAGVALSMVMGDGSIVNQATSATEKTRAGEIKEEISVALAEQKTSQYSGINSRGREEVIEELYNKGKLTSDEVEQLKSQTTIVIDGEEIDFSEIQGLNEYGLYLNKKYICENFVGEHDEQNVEVVFKDNKSIEINSFITGRTFSVGDSINMEDFLGVSFATTGSMKTNQVYSGKGSFDMDCKCWYDSNGVAYYNFVLNDDIVSYENQKVNIGGGSLVITFFDNGRKFDFGGNTFVLK